MNLFRTVIRMDQKIKACCLKLKSYSNKDQRDSNASFLEKFLLPYLKEIFVTEFEQNLISAMYAFFVPIIILCLTQIFINLAGPRKRTKAEDFLFFLSKSSHQNENTIIKQNQVTSSY